MEIVELSLRSSNQFINDLTEKKLHVESFFDYNVHSSSLFRERAEDLRERTYQREELATYLKNYTNRCLNSDEKILENIERLKNPDSLVVIGGQQAGLLTGPLYTIHKIISIIVLAEKEEKELGVPVIPVFWIAGEDHDFVEINHVFIEKNQIARKLAIKDSPVKKQPVSQLELNKQKTFDWIDQVFEAFGETDYSNQLISTLKQFAEESSTYVEFFEKVIMDLFKDKGLVLINSGDHELRKLEKSYFKSILEQNERIYDAVKEQQQKMQSLDYHPIIEMTDNSANLFYHHDGERFLLERISHNEYEVSEIGFTITRAELFDLIETNPEKFSNNVVTRPLMQEYLFPTLAFIAGPGEVTYWSELKGVFSLFDIKMPPVLPRLQMTILERAIDRNIKETGVELEAVLQEGVMSSMNNFLKEMSPVDMAPLIEEAKKEISEIHTKLVDAALLIDQSLEPMLKKNGHFIKEHLDFIYKTVENRKKQQHDSQLSKFKSIEQSLLPNLHPQERVWNVYYYLNKFGPNFVGELLNLSYSFNGTHKIVKI
ncbi:MULTISPECIES: bacillithiol biosynthesis cysteine-adding enzyme BshC [Bacillaceae]|uniref:bacillithiol biosynthesis cysteine-adding enzyme BshC n=1 Tax=Bacillaceae TaxID=186817 RepID=UPI00159B9E89|nr:MULTISPECIES: bacillithiol biosynthesis cysteine-adding enzyme BshC [Bacillaceae]UGB32567.1 bacillithiol biosynthesis cysteine-adding enzyme BshC [Metabacillus sp. B2-18]